ncbi:MAG TPA: MFS transporter [Bacteroidia bacterium]|nr:MFS transporter [Bacteroidia bacterium]MBP9924142.1 MFS transporter [Bacteroidia bacterium]HQW22779.1 MFS transporter [Bacteroidia bacterium]
MEKTTQAISKSALPTLVTVFFFWGFVAASNGIFIPFCKTHFNLDQFQSQLIDTSFYGAYFFGSLILYLMSAVSGVDILNRIGFKNGIILGLSMSIIGAVSLAFVASGTGATFGMVLACFFIIALGFSLQQTAAQPFAIALGNPATGAHRLNFAGGINSLGTLLGPIAVSVVLFGDLNNEGTATIQSIKTLYLILAGLFLFVALFFFVSKNLPTIKMEEHVENSSKAMRLLFIIAIPTIVLLFFNNMFGENEKVYLVIGSLVFILGALFYALIAAQKNKSGWGAMQYPQLVMGMIAIFVYVGMEVTVQSNMGALLRQPEFGGLDEKYISQFISLYWGSLMVGRWTGALAVFDLKKSTKNLLMIVVPLVAFALILFVNHMRGNEIKNMYVYVISIFILIGAFFYANERPAKMLFTVAFFGLTAMVIGLLTTGQLSTFAFISGGLACSVMWPCIFALAVTGLGKYTSQGSAFLIMMILGGAIIPPTQGVICDFDKMTTGGIAGMSYTHFSYIVPLICFAYMVWHAIKTKSILKSQGLDYDQQVSGH